MVHGIRAHLGRKVDNMMLYSGTKSHLTPLADLIQSTTQSDISFTPADTSQMGVMHVGVHKVRVQGEYGVRSVILSDTLIVPDAGRSPMSVPDLVNKNISVLLMPGYAVLFDLLDADCLLGLSKQHDDGLFFVCDDGSTSSPSTVTADIEKIRSMMTKLPSPNFMPIGHVEGSVSSALRTKTA